MVLTSCIFLISDSYKLHTDSSWKCFTYTGNLNHYIYIPWVIPSLRHCPYIFIPIDEYIIFIHEIYLTEVYSNFILARYIFANILYKKLKRVYFLNFILFLTFIAVCIFSPLFFISWEYYLKMFLILNNLSCILLWTLNIFVYVFVFILPIMFGNQ